MRKSLVFKLFMFTFALSIGFFVFVIGTQTLFFERFYQQMKTRELATQIKRYEEATNLAQELYLEYGIWVTTLDSQGTIADMSGYRITVRPENTEEELEIPLYAMIGEFGAGEALLLSKGEKVVIDAVEKDSHMTVYQLASENGAVSLVNTTLAEKLHGNTADTKYKEVKTVCFQGEIVATDLPSNIDEIPYLFQEQSFLEQIKQFQATLLATEGTKMLQEQSYYMSSNLSEYEVLIKPEIQKGEKKYIFAMISLQPVDEAVAILRQFSLLFFIVILILALVAALVYSKWLAKPLLLANRVTKKMTKLDFSEKLLVRSQDEIGQLAANINYLSDELEQHICYLQKELEREQQLEKTRKKFISNVSHELKTPLAVMKSTISILEDDIAKEKKEYYFSAMENKIDEMNALIMEMLDLAKMESGTYKPELVPFALDKTIITVCEAFRSAMEQKNLQLVADTQETIVVGHEGLITRVVTNLISNAVRYTQTGGKICVCIERKEEAVSVSVENQSEHLSEEELTHVFDQFYRTESNSVNGTGLGLAIVKTILELHHAEYGVENTQNGVRFFFTLPVA